jgi:hypothetical protein
VDGQVEQLELIVEELEAGDQHAQPAKNPLRTTWPHVE